MALIKHQQLVEDPWLRLQTLPARPETSQICVPWDTFLESPDRWIALDCELGVSVSGDVEPAELEPYLDQLALVTVVFEKFTDGRGYSLARLLRERFGYDKELRASGDIMRDQLLFLSRCGFDAFEVKEGKDALDALESFQELPVRYQPAGDGATPPWKARARVV